MILNPLGDEMEENGLSVINLSEDFYSYFYLAKLSGAPEVDHDLNNFPIEPSLSIIIL